MLRLTPVVKNLVIVNVIVFILQMLLPGLTGIDLTSLLSLWNLKTNNFQPYQLFTYMFAHGGLMHIFFNMLMLAFTGPILETFWGPKRFLTFYLVTGLGAGIFNLLVDYYFFEGITFGSILGASGAIYGVLMGFGMIFPNMEVMLLFPPIPIKAKYLVWVLGIMTFLMSGSGVAHLAHLGGIVFAYIMIRIWRNQGGTWQ